MNAPRQPSGAEPAAPARRCGLARLLRICAVVVAAVPLLGAARGGPPVIPLAPGLTPCLTSPAPGDPGGYGGEAVPAAPWLPAAADPAVWSRMPQAPYLPGGCLALRAH